jgi:hypothetical protein
VCACSRGAVRMRAGCSCIIPPASCTRAELMHTWFSRQSNPCFLWPYLRSDGGILHREHRSDHCSVHIIPRRSSYLIGQGTPVMFIIKAEQEIRSISNIKRLWRICDLVGDQVKPGAPPAPSRRWARTSKDSFVQGSGVRQMSPSKWYDLPPLD